MPVSTDLYVKRRLITVSVVVIILCGNTLFAGQRLMIGPNITMSWASSYLTINTDAITVQNDASWTYATAAGWFVDYQLNPYVSIRSEWFIYPVIMNCNPFRSLNSIGQIQMSEFGFSVLRHFGKGYVSPWFGAGPYLQYAALDTINSYIIHIILSLGFDYEISDDIFFCPELMFGLGASLIKSENKTVQFDVPSGSDFSTSGIVIFIKLGIARAF
jgi:hypothetical protein